MAAPDVAGARDAQDATAVRDQLERGFRRLTPEQRAVLVVHHYLGLPDAEAAVVLDIAVGTFKSRLSRASVALRAALEADERTATIATESIA
jgi:RNA polymerase sigma-70 factor (ECF subfamily)